MEDVQQQKHRRRLGQIVCGPPGAGKSTYCDGVSQFFNAVERKSNYVLNLDPASENVSYDVAIDVRDLIDVEVSVYRRTNQVKINLGRHLISSIDRLVITLLNLSTRIHERNHTNTHTHTHTHTQSVMKETGLGPNGSTIYCMEYLEKNFDWLKDEILELERNTPGESYTYLIVDCPGQVELVTHHESLEKIIKRLKEELGFELCAVHLVDSNFCLEPSKFLSSIVLSISVMLRIALPHINVLSKLDLLEKSGALKFDLEFYMNCIDVRGLLEQIKSSNTSGDGDNDDLDDDGDKLKPISSKQTRHTFTSLNKAFCDIIEDFNLVSFLAMNVEDKICMARVAQAVDKALGYSGGPGTKQIETLCSSKSFIHDLQEKYVRRTDAL